jgi:hypothetical protein
VERLPARGAADQAFLRGLNLLTRGEIVFVDASSIVFASIRHFPIGLNISATTPIEYS